MAENPGTTPNPEAKRRKRPQGGTPRHRLLADRIARVVVTGGGLAIIASILGILVFLLLEVWPLTRAARVETAASTQIETELLALRGDEHRTHVAGVTEDGRVIAYRLQGPESGKEVASIDLPGRASATTQGARPRIVQAIAPPYEGGTPPVLAALTDDGRALLVPIEFVVSFEGDDRSVQPTIGTVVEVPLAPPSNAGQPTPSTPTPTAFAAGADAEGSTTVATVTGETLSILRRTTETNAMTGESSSIDSVLTLPAPAPISVLTLDGQRRFVYGGAQDGRIFRWDLEAGDGAAPRVASAGSSPITAMTLLIGDRSLVVGQADGAISVWFPLEASDGQASLTRIRDFPKHSSGIRTLAPSPRDKGFLALDQKGGVGLYFSTSHRTLWRGQAPTGATTISFTPKADGATFAGGHQLGGLTIDNPHPEVTWKTLFGKTWFEGYDKPQHVWQSTGGTDDFEPKLSLVPLLVGTLKGTFYSLLLAIPLGVFGAMFISQFMHPSYKRTLKPAIEIMASLPSVVLGFLAGLWLAPRVEKAFPALILMTVLVPVSVLLAGAAWNKLPQPIRNRFRAGTEALFFLPVIVAAGWLALLLGPGFEQLAFDGNFAGWLSQTTGWTYDQRNAIVVGLAMGFAVIPIIFAIAEDAFSNVPQNLVAGSLALGANRWQTVTRVVLPTASPGIFSAIMIGFGRAIGETMIVLMATGNTPILDWNPFNGFRTLSANIAVEIPEAPHGGTLYRTLFLAALLLFALTFAVNTVAELVRQRLRERYSQL